MLSQNRPHDQPAPAKSSSAIADAATDQETSLPLISADNFADFFLAILNTPLARHADPLADALRTRFKTSPSAQLSEWTKVLQRLPRVPVSGFDLTRDEVRLEASHPQGEDFVDLLQTLHPWRKGPFHLLGVPMDTEWRSDWKWRRLEPHLNSLTGARVLDVGCGNGYHCWRMRGAGAELVVGIDPTWLYLAQFMVVKHFLPDQPVFMLPLKSEDLPGNMAAFDTVFSMGVLYHRRSPLDHLEELRQCLRPGGQLVLETLVIESGDLLMPEDRYASMRNVWFIPGLAMLETWVRRSGFSAIKTVDVTATTLNEQRPTPWMTFHSLADFLDPADRRLTLEGHPAPVRAIVTATRS